MAYLIPAALVIVSAVGTGVSVASSVQQGEEQKKGADFQKRQLELQALEAKQTAGMKVAAQDARAAAILSSIRATSAASGVDPSSGSPLQDYTTSSEQAQLNDMYTKYAGNIQAQGAEAQGALTEYGGKNAQSAGYLTATGDVISGVGSMGATVLKYPKSFGIN